MGVKVASGACLHFVSQSPSSFAPAASFASPCSSSSSKRRRINDRSSLVCQVVKHRPDRSVLFGQTSRKLLRSVSCDIPKLGSRPIRRAASASANLDGFSDEEFSEKLRELALQFSVSEEDEDEVEHDDVRITPSDGGSTTLVNSTTCHPSLPTRIESMEPLVFDMMKHWAETETETDEFIPAIERKANCVDIPLSLRIIKKKNQLSEGFMEAGESAVKKAFSYMVFIIRELHSYTLQMRELLYFEDLQGVLVRVQKELNASFVWLFQQIFSHTPTLMVSVMILLANFTVHSMAHNVAMAAPMTLASHAPVTEMQSFVEFENHNDPSFDSSTSKTFSVSSASGKTASVGGRNGGGGKFKQIASGTDGGDGQFDGASSFNHHQIIPDEVSQVSSFGNPTIESESQEKIAMDDEMKLWNSVLEEASRMQVVLMDETLDHETMQQFVSPITAQIQPEDYSDYFRTELIYQQAISQDPSNSLFLSNYAQFLYLVVHDHDRAENYFKLASQIKPADAEALSKYAKFLWMARNDLDAAEEQYLEAIEADPGNVYHAGNYAHFLWNTGGEDTCYPLSTA